MKKEKVFNEILNEVRYATRIGAEYGTEREAFITVLRFRALVSSLFDLCSKEYRCIDSYLLSDGFMEHRRFVGPREEFIGPPAFGA